jgi:hypothetical protein
MVLEIGLRFAGSNPAEEDGFLRATKSDFLLRG